MALTNNSLVQAASINFIFLLALYPQLDPQLLNSNIYLQLNKKYTNIRNLIFISHSLILFDDLSL